LEGETLSYELTEKNRIAFSGSNLLKEESSQGQDSDLSYSHVSITNNGTAVSLTRWNDTHGDNITVLLW